MCNEREITIPPKTSKTGRTHFKEYHFVLFANMAKTHSMAEVARHFGVSQTTVRKATELYDVPRRRPGCQPLHLRTPSTHVKIPSPPKPDATTGRKPKTWGALEQARERDRVPVRPAHKHSQYR